MRDKQIIREYRIIRGHLRPSWIVYWVVMTLSLTYGLFARREPQYHHFLLFLLWITVGPLLWCVERKYKLLLAKDEIIIVHPFRKFNDCVVIPISDLSEIRLHQSMYGWRWGIAGIFEFYLKNGDCILT